MRFFHVYVLAERVKANAAIYHIYSNVMLKSCSSDLSAEVESYRYILGVSSSFMTLIK